ncbi:GNAT family N-acetyltransferase [Xinfangfangia pollutisoli]|uniref:GNAT family N-acetyltransferase n=1 Tax=Xinfangfangia pollutisoli TaxID=2865960 RepID=UPI001CD4E8B3|nr:GNAT family N-acetyltransferase [Xinfangfangia pollutisoli]
MSTDPHLSKESGPTKGRYLFRKDGAEAEITFSVTTPTLIIADHTGVPDAFRGQGVGLKLVEFMVADARAHGFKIVPLCPFVNAQRKKHPEWADVFQA